MFYLIYCFFFYPLFEPIQYQKLDEVQWLKCGCVCVFKICYSNFSMNVFQLEGSSEKGYKYHKAFVITLESLYQRNCNTSSFLIHLRNKCVAVPHVCAFFLSVQYKKTFVKCILLPIDK